MNNADYWARRLKIMEDALKDQSYEYVKNLEQQFDAAIAQIDTQMRAWYQRFADNNGGISYAEAQKLLTAGELKEFKWTVQQYIKAGKEHAISGAWAKELENASARVHISRLESLKIQLRQQAEALTQARVKATTDASALSYTQSYYHTAFEVQRGLGVGWTLQALNTNTVQKVLSRPWTVDNQTFTARCWTDKTKLVETVNQELTRMLATGEAPDKAIAAISKRFNVSKQNAGRVVMTESAYFSSAAQKDCFNELGVEKYRIVGTLDTKTCNICGDMDGKVFKMSDYRPGSTAPPFHPWCRCCTAPYFDDMDGVGERYARDAEGRSYKFPRDMNYQSWKAYNNAVAHEPKITETLRTVVENTGHELSGIEHRIKTPESYTRKINNEAAASRLAHTGFTYEEAYSYATSRMYDTVRYTALTDSEKFTESYNKAVYNLRKMGYTISRVKNSITDTNAVYRGVNIVVTTPDDFNFELQFHTPESLEVKNKNHLLYEEARKSTTSSEKRKELEYQMKKFASGLKAPKGAETIKTFDNLKGR